MNNNILVIIFSGISISLLGLVLLLLPSPTRQMIDSNIEYFLTIPPISVASYILVFKYLENFQVEVPTIGELLSKIFLGSVAAFVFFFVMAVFIGLLFRTYIIYMK
jgi:hypothetical protein